MSKIRTYIDMIVANGKQEDMDCLGDMLEDLIYDMKEAHPDIYKKHKMKLFGMAYNHKFNEELAHEIVEDMKPLGEYWNYETIQNVKMQYGLNNIDANDLYIVMNSLANDYNEVINLDDVETYVKMAKAFIKDEDATSHKVWKYFTTIPKKD